MLVNGLQASLPRACYTVLHPHKSIHAHAHAVDFDGRNPVFLAANYSGLNVSSRLIASVSTHYHQLKRSRRDSVGWNMPCEPSQSQIP